MKHEPKGITAADVIDILATALAERVAERLNIPAPAPAPVEADEVWNSRQVCQYLGIGASTLRERQKLSGFPKRINNEGHPKWLASDIRAYQPAPVRRAS